MTERYDTSRALFVVLGECCKIIVDLGEADAAATARNILSSGESGMASQEIANCAFRLAAQLRCSNYPHAATVRRILMQIASAHCWQKNPNAAKDSITFQVGGTTDEKGRPSQLAWRTAIPGGSEHV